MKLMQVVPENYLLHAHHWLILHGRYTCVARRPLCEKCIIADLCKWPGKTVNAPPAPLNRHGRACPGHPRLYREQTPLTESHRPRLRRRRP